MPSHTHQQEASGRRARDESPSATVALGIATETTYGSTAAVDMSAQAVLNKGGSQAHNNMQPYLAMNFIIALQGLYPSRS